MCKYSFEYALTVTLPGIDTRTTGGEISDVVVAVVTFQARAATLPDTQAWLDGLASVTGMADPWLSTATIQSENNIAYYALTGTVNMITVLGTYSNTNAFLDAIQNQVDRLLLVSTLSVTRQDAADNTGTGRPSTALGYVELTINGFLFECLDATPTVADQTGAEDQSAEPTPLPTSDRNPFASITG